MFKITSSAKSDYKRSKATTYPKVTREPDYKELEKSKCRMRTRPKQRCTTKKEAAVPSDPHTRAARRGAAQSLCEACPKQDNAQSEARTAVNLSKQKRKNDTRQRQEGKKERTRGSDPTR